MMDERDDGCYFLL
jgi:hypothetical protein